MKILFTLCVLCFSINTNALIPKYVAIIQMTPPVISLDKYNIALEKATVTARNIEYFYRYYDKHNIWDIQIKPFVLQSFCNPSPPGWCKPEVKALFQEEEFVPKYFQLHSQFADGKFGYAGIGEMPGFYTTVYAGAGHRTAMHELGHNWGLNHASGVGRHDNSDLMGFIQIGNSPGFNLPNLWKLGFIANEDKTIIETSQQILLAPIELNTNATHEIEDQYVAVKTSKDDIFISVRKRKGTFYKPDIQSNPANTVFIHEYSVMLRTNLLKRLYPGEHVHINNVTVTYLDYEQETARLNITYGTKSVHELIRPEGLPQLFNAVNTTPLHSGLWYNPIFNGQGFDVQIKDEIVTVIWYTFNEYNSYPRYYIGSYNLNNDSEFNLYTTDNKELISVGKAKLTFTSDTEGVFNFDTTEHGRGSAAIEALALSNDTMNGLWVTSAENEGFSFQFFNRNQRKTVTGYWYTHDIPDRYLDNTSQRWFMLQGNETEENKYTFTIYEIVGGKWLFFDKATATPIGSGNIEILDNNNMLLRYELEDQYNNLVLFRLIRLF